MDSRPNRSTAFRGLCCTLLALCVHGAVAFALPVSGSTHVDQANVEMIWLATGIPAPMAATAPTRAVDEDVTDAPVMAGLQPASNRNAQSRFSTVRARRHRPARARHVLSASTSAPPRGQDQATAPAADARVSGAMEGSEAVAAAEGSGSARPTKDVPGMAAQATGRKATPPQLRPLHGSPCRLYFPAEADRDEGEVVVRTHVDATGRIERVDVVEERPAAQGFGRAAKACAQRLRFVPARDVDDVAVPGAATLQLRFTRS